jgi:uncharacterized membrane protein
MRDYLITLLVYLSLDLLWMGVVARQFYTKHLGYLFKPNFDLVAGVLFYLLFCVGLLVFVIRPAQRESHSLLKSMSLGFLFGLVAYSAYDLTNHATIKGWPLIVTVVDMLWGGALSAISVGTFLYLS